MFTVKISTGSPSWPFALQTPGGGGIWKNCRFVVDDPSCTVCDAWIVYEDLGEEEEVLCPPERRIFITGEPPFFSYEKGFLRQFSRIITSHSFDHPGVIQQQQGLPWHIGRVLQKGGDLFRENYDSLCAKKVPEKTMLLSAIISTKRKTPGQILRLRLVEYLKHRLGDRMELFGNGHRPIPCKGDAIFPARYHLVLENHDAPHYWSEKLADCYLGWSFPLYWGCRNLEEYFPPESFLRIPAEDPGRACVLIEAFLEEDPFESRLPLLRQSRELVLHTYNFFALACQLTSSLPQGKAQKVRLYPRRNFRGLRKFFCR
jgi:hypothetical protein